MPGRRAPAVPAALDRTHAAVRGGLRAVRRQHLLRPAADRPHRGHAADARRPGRADHDADPARLRRRAALPGAAGRRGGKPPADPGRDGRRGRGPGRDRLVELGRRLSRRPPSWSAPAPSRPRCWCPGLAPGGRRDTGQGGRQHHGRAAGRNHAGPPVLQPGGLGLRLAGGVRRSRRC